MVAHCITDLPGLVKNFASRQAAAEVVLDEKGADQADFVLLLSVFALLQVVLASPHVVLLSLHVDLPSLHVVFGWPPIVQAPLRVFLTLLQTVFGARLDAMSSLLVVFRSGHVPLPPLPLVMPLMPAVLATLAVRKRLAARLTSRWGIAGCPVPDRSRFCAVFLLISSAY